MSKATEQLRRTVEAGAVLTVRLVTGDQLGPWPIDYLRIDEDAGTVEYAWIGPEERIHLHEIGDVQALEDGQVSIVVPTLGDLLVEPIWDPRHEAALATWTEQVKADPGLRNYPEGAYRYAL